MKLGQIVFLAGVILLIFFPPVHAQLSDEAVPHPGRYAPQTVIPSQIEDGAVTLLGMGDTVYLTVFGQPDMSAQLTVDDQGNIVVPLLGQVPAGGWSPSAVAKEIAAGLRSQGYLTNPQVSIEVVRVRSRIASVLGEVAKPGRYVLDGQLSVLELLAKAGGVKETADDVAFVIRRDSKAESGQRRIEVVVANKQLPDQPVEDLPLEPGDVLYVPQVRKFYIYGEVLRSGAYPMEPELNVMRALALAGGLTQRGSERRVSISRKDRVSGELHKQKVRLDALVQPGDVIYVDERFF